jgi:hypothetical protein
VVIPKALREAAVEIEYRAGKIEIELVHRPPRLVRKSGLLIAVPSSRAPKLTTGAVNRIIHDLRERRLPS